jgi:hypothetical protein
MERSAKRQRTTTQHVVHEMERVLLLLRSSTATVYPEAIAEVPGAIILRSCLTPSECVALAAQVRRVHVEWKDEQVERKRAGDQLKGAATLATAAIDMSAVPRRRSQHHLPCRVSASSMAALCARVRPFVSTYAGPKNPADRAVLLTPGTELSTFLRCYHYQTGDTSTPHYDKSFTTHVRAPSDIGDDSNNNKSSSKNSQNSKNCNSNGGKNSGKSNAHSRQKRGGGGALETFSAYSVLLYVNDGFEGGATTFFKHNPDVRITRRGLTPVPEDLDKLEPIAKVIPRCGDVLIFPHGNFNGCHPNPLHEGSIVVSGEKCLIRTDLLYRAPPSIKHKRKRKKVRE